MIPPGNAQSVSPRRNQCSLSAGRSPITVASKLIEFDVPLAIGTSPLLVLFGPEFEMLGRKPGQIPVRHPVRNGGLGDHLQTAAVAGRHRQVDETWRIERQRVHLLDAGVT
jgi:hypothetical protein